MVSNNFNQSITVTRKLIHLKIDWEFISSPGYLNKSHPFCKENNIISWEKNKHIDELIYLNNFNLYQRVYFVGRKNRIYIINRGKIKKKI